MKSVFVKNKDGLYYDAETSVGDVKVVEQVVDVVELVK